MSSLGEYPIIAAVEDGDRDMVRDLIMHGADVNIRTDDGLTPLEAAIDYKHMSIALLLMDHGATPYPYMLIDAIRTNYTYLAMRMIESGVNINTTVNNRTPLIDSIERLDFVLVRLLIRKGANINGRVNGITPLIVAIITYSNEIVRLLLEAGADPNGRDDVEDTPLLIATRSGYNTMVSLLLQYGADPDVQDEDGKTPLMYAIDHNKVYMVRTLIDAHASLTLKNILLYAAKKVTDGDVDVSILDMIVRAGVNLDMQDRDGSTALMMVSAIKDDPLPTIILLDHGANPNIRDNGGYTALMIAAHAGNIDTCKALIAHGADTSVTSRDGQTAYTLTNRDDIKNLISRNSSSIYLSSVHNSTRRMYPSDMDTYTI